jgi:hypothetical protein
MEAVPFELAGMTATCGTEVGVSDCAGFGTVTVPFETTTGGVAALERGSVVLTGVEVVLACGEVVACDAALLFACDAVGFSDTGMSATGTGALACDMVMPICEWSRRDQERFAGDDGDITVRKCMCLCGCSRARIRLLVSCAGRITLKGISVLMLM